MLSRIVHETRTFISIVTFSTSGGVPMLLQWKEILFVATPENVVLGFSRQSHVLLLLMLWLLVGSTASAGSAGSAAIVVPRSDAAVVVCHEFECVAVQVRVVLNCLRSKTPLFVVQSVCADTKW